MVKLIFSNIKWIALIVLGLFLFTGSSLTSLMNILSGKSDVEPKSETDATITDEYAQNLAEQLYAALEGVGTDEETVFSIFSKLKNRSDYNKLYNSFGMRQYSRFWGNMGDPISSGLYDLTTWLTYELKPDEMEQLLNKNPQLNIF